MKPILIVDVVQVKRCLAYVLCPIRPDASKLPYDGLAKIDGSKCSQKNHGLLIYVDRCQKAYVKANESNNLVAHGKCSVATPSHLRSQQCFRKTCACRFHVANGVESDTHQGESSARYKHGARIQDDGALGNLPLLGIEQRLRKVLPMFLDVLLGRH